MTSILSTDVVNTTGVAGYRPLARQYSATIPDSEFEIPTVDGRNINIDVRTNTIPVIRDAVCIFIKVARRI
jgi:hypothetical protein